jgi:hypothetical protein
MTRALLQRILSSLEDFNEQSRHGVPLPAEIDTCMDLLREYLAQSQLNVWERVVDDALVCAHLGVANEDDDYETAKQKLTDLICWSIQVDKDLAQPRMTDD